MSINTLIALLFLVFLNITVIAQKKYQNGYYITNSGERSDVLILNEEWKKTGDLGLFEAQRLKFKLRYKIICKFCRIRRI